MTYPQASRSVTICATIGAGQAFSRRSGLTPFFLGARFCRKYLRLQQKEPYRERRREQKRRKQLSVFAPIYPNKIAEFGGHVTLPLPFRYRWLFTFPFAPPIRPLRDR